VHVYRIPFSIASVPQIHFDFGGGVLLYKSASLTLKHSPASTTRSEFRGEGRTFLADRKRSHAEHVHRKDTKNFVLPARPILDHTPLSLYDSDSRNDWVPYMTRPRSELSISSFQVKSASEKKVHNLHNQIMPERRTQSVCEQLVFEKLRADKLTRVLELSSCILSILCNSTHISVTRL